MDAARVRRLADQIGRIVALMLERRIKDPRLGFVTVTDVRLTGDLRDATVYYTVYGPQEERAATAAALDSAKGVIRSEVGRQTGLRHTPSLSFVADTVPDNARHIEELLEQARVADAEVERRREGALPAGDPDPYRPSPNGGDADDGSSAEPSRTAGPDSASEASGSAPQRRRWAFRSGGRNPGRSPDGPDHEAGYSGS